VRGRILFAGAVVLAGSLCGSAFGQPPKPEKLHPWLQGLIRQIEQVARELKPRSASHPTMGRVLGECMEFGPIARPVAPALRKMLSKAPPRMQGGVIDALLAVGEPPESVVPVLQEHLKHSSMKIRAAAAGRLAAIGLPAKAAIPSLVTALASSADRASGARGAAIARRAAQDALTVRRVAAHALAQLAPASVAPLTAALKDRDPNVRQSAAGAIGQIGLPQAESALPALQQGLRDRVLRVQLACGTALARMGQERKTLPAIVRLLQHKDEGWRRVAVDSVGDVGPVAKGAVPALAVVLGREKSDNLRAAAARAIGKVGKGSKAAAAALTQAIQRDRSRYVRRAAATALGQVGSAAGSAVPLLAELVRRDKYSRDDAIRAIGEIGLASNAAASVLVEALLDPNSRGTSVAAEALARLGPAAKGRVAKLAKVLKDAKSPKHLRYAAARALSRIDPASVGLVLTRELQSLVAGRCNWAADAAAFLEPVPPDVLAAVHSALVKGRPDVRQSAARALCTIAPTAPDVRATLAKAAAADDSIRVRAWALKALRRIDAKLAAAKTAPTP